MDCVTRTGHGWRLASLPSSRQSRRPATYLATRHKFPLAPPACQATQPTQTHTDSLTRRSTARADHFAWSRVLWDVATIAWLLEPAWVPSELVPSPVLTDQVTWSVDRRRHLIRCAGFVHRDPIFGDLFRKLAAAA